MNKTERIENRKLLDSYYVMRCAACGRLGCDPCHVQSVGAGGHDIHDNVMPLCRAHHSEQHQVGWVRFSTKYAAVGQLLKLKGWVIDSYRLRRLVSRED